MTINGALHLLEIGLMDVKTHVANAAGTHCIICRRAIPPIERDGHILRLTPGQRVGIVAGLKTSEDSSYEIKGNDSNQLCGPLPT